MSTSFENMEIEPAGVAALLESGRPFKLIDVREDWEHEYCRIDGSLHIPLDQLEARHAAELDPAEAIVLYCHSGMRSWQAAAWLRQQGYRDVKSLAGGVSRWADDIDPDMPRY